MGISKERVMELAEKWDVNDLEAPKYAEFINIQLGIDGSSKFATLSDFIDLQSSPAGFGDTYLEAIAALIKDLIINLGSPPLW